MNVVWVLLIVVGGLELGLELLPWVRGSFALRIFGIWPASLCLHDVLWSTHWWHHIIHNHPFYPHYTVPPTSDEPFAFVVAIQRCIDELWTQGTIGCDGN